MGWLCTICDTLNTTGTFRGDDEICKYCKIKKELYHPNFDHCLVVNERIDNYFPRHHINWELNSELLYRIGFPTFIVEKTYKYIFDRLRYRNTQTSRKWRRKVCRRKFLKIILSKINKQRDEQIENQLIMQYLL